MKKQDQSMNSETEDYCKKLKKLSTILYAPRLGYIIIKLILVYLSISEKIFKPDYSIRKRKYIIHYNLKCLEFLIDILIPLNNILDAIIEYRNFKLSVINLKESIPNSLRKDSTMEDIYNLLRQIPKSETKKLLREISPDLPKGEYLIHLLYTNDKENFIKTLFNGNYNLHYIKEFCDIYGYKIQIMKNMDEFPKRCPDKEVLIQKTERILNEHIKNGKADELIRIYSHVMRGNVTKKEISKKDIYSLTKYTLITHFLLMNEYTSFEKKVLKKFITRINHNPYYKKVYDKIYSIYQKELSGCFNNTSFSDILETETKVVSKMDSSTPNDLRSKENLRAFADSSVRNSDNIDVNSNGNFFLDENYFKQQTVYDDKIYFPKLKESIKSEGGTKFMEFINWLAEDGYVDNNPKTKATLAFRLTGIYPPKDLEEKIEWKIDVNNLAYIIRYFYPQTSKWSKINIFFCSKLQKFNSLSSSYADNVDEQFKNKIWEFYPNIESKE